MITEFFLKLAAGCKRTHFVDKIQTILLVDELYVYRAVGTGVATKGAIGTPPVFGHDRSKVII